MSSFAPTGSTRALPIYTTVLAWFFAAACVAAAIYIPVFDRANWELMGSIVNLAAGVLVAAGCRARHPWGVGWRALPCVDPRYADRGARPHRALRAGCATRLHGRR